MTDRVINESSKRITQAYGGHNGVDLGYRVNEEENKNEGVNSTSVNEFNMNDPALMQKLFEMQQMLMQQLTDLVI